MKARATGAFALVLLAMIIFPGVASAQSAQGGLKNGLPPTTMDSFVRTAAGNADLIYGDEGTYDIPPYFGFTYQHRINNGINDVRDKGLTTGHGSNMPSATGADEFIAPGNPGGEWSLSGANNGNPQSNGAGAPGYDFSPQQQQLADMNSDLTQANNQLVNAQNALQAALAAAQAPNATPAQRMAANIAADDIRRQITGLQNSIQSMNSNISGMSTHLAQLESDADRY